MSVSKVVVFHGPGLPLELRGIPIPRLQPREILVRNEFTTLCRSDLNTYSGKRIEPTPTILGHEIVGRIAALGESAPRLDLRGKPLAEGTRISWGIYASDPTCVAARRGFPQKGDDLFKYGHERLTESSVLHGGLGDYTILRADTPIVAVDEAIPAKVAAIINCAAATVAAAVRLAGDVHDRNVLISGTGMLGMLACAMCRLRGARLVAAQDVDPNRVAAARSFGADLAWIAGSPPIEPIPSTVRKSPSGTVRDPGGNPATFDLVIELSGAASAMEQTLDLLEVGGVAVWVGATYPQPPLRLNAERIVRNLITIKGLHNYNQDDLIEAVRFIERAHHAFPIASMIQEGFTLENANAAFEFGIAANPFRVGVDLGTNLPKPDASEFGRMRPAAGHC